MQSTKLNEVIKNWGGNTHRLDIGIDGWIADYEDLSGAIGKNIFIDNNETIIELLITHDMSTGKFGGIVTAAWFLGRMSEDYIKSFDPKSAIRLGQGKRLQSIIQKAQAKKEIEGKNYVFQPYIGPMNYSAEEEDQPDHVTQTDDVQFFTDVLTEQGIKHVRAYLTGKIVSEIKNRLTQLRVAEVDIKPEARKLKKAIDGIVKELS